MLHREYPRSRSPSLHGAPLGSDFQVFLEKWWTSLWSRLLVYEDRPTSWKKEDLWVRSTSLGQTRTQSQQTCYLGGLCSQAVKAAALVRLMGVCSSSQRPQPHTTARSCPNR